MILRALARRDIRGGSAVDPFCGTASVARELKRVGFAVTAADIMRYAYVFARAYVELTDEPAVDCLARALDLRARSLDGVLAHLNALPPAPGFMHEQFSPAGSEGGRHGRMYFTPENAARIDAVRGALDDWCKRGLLEEDAYHALLAALIEAADRVANTTGVYAAFVKSWQPNALKPLELRIDGIVEGNSCHARQADAVELVENHEPFDLLYLDPPYNARQYAGYYHIPEIIAMGWFDAPPPLRGKTGLPPDAHKRSDWCRTRHCEAVFERLVSTARWRHIVMSYNAEGIIPESTIERVLKENGRRSTYRRYKTRYRRYRSDADGENRRYRGDEVEEYLYCIDR